MQMNWSRMVLSWTGFFRCGEPDPCNRNKTCVKSLFAKYKFYLAFENSHCEDYITEKTWKSLDAGMLPGTTIYNCEQRLSPDSFLHVDNFTSPAKLAKYLKYLNNNQDAYRRYHLWSNKCDVFYIYGTNILWVCDMCKKIHNPAKPVHVNLSQWWTLQEQCNEYK